MTLKDINIKTGEPLVGDSVALPAVKIVNGRRRRSYNVGLVVAVHRFSRAFLDCEINVQFLDGYVRGIQEPEIFNLSKVEA